MTSPLFAPASPGAVSQGKDREEALMMIADAMAVCQRHPLPGDETEARWEIGKGQIAELAAECEEEGLEYYVCVVLRS